MYGYDPNRTRRHHVVAGILSLILAAVLSVSLADAAHSDPVVDHDPALYVQRIEPVVNRAGVTLLSITLSNGKRDVLRPCVYEDGRHCYWVSSERGNGIGHSFIVTHGIVFYVNLRWVNR